MSTLFQRNKGVGAGGNFCRGRGNGGQGDQERRKKSFLSERREERSDFGESLGRFQKKVGESKYEESGESGVCFGRF